MSRGPGRVQVAIMRALKEGYDEYGRPELWLCISTVDLGLREHRESRRRAAHQLGQAGLIELCRAPRDIATDSPRSRAGSVTRSLLFARLPYEPSHLAHTLELRAEYEQKLAVLLDPEAEQRELRDAERWVAWYEEPERTLWDLGDGVVPILFSNTPASAAVRLLAAQGFR